MGINTEFEHPSQEKDDIVMVAKVVVAPIKTCVRVQISNYVYCVTILTTFAQSYFELCQLCNYFDFICPKLSL
jgi:hypothetical protein